MKLFVSPANISLMKIVHLNLHNEKFRGRLGKNNTPTTQGHKFAIKLGWYFLTNDIFIDYLRRVENQNRYWQWDGCTCIVVKTPHEHREGMHFKTTFFGKPLKYLEYKISCRGEGFFQLFNNARRTRDFLMENICYGLKWRHRVFHHVYIFSPPKVGSVNGACRCSIIVDLYNVVWKRKPKV
jgi:hypothetical protein